MKLLANPVYVHAWNMVKKKKKNDYCYKNFVLKLWEHIWRQSEFFPGIEEEQGSITKTEK